MQCKRIAKELASFEKEPLRHVYLDYQESDLTCLQVLMIGPRHSPYSRMFLRFRIRFPKDYPIAPPKVEFISSYGKKIHPNVFPGGWVCLSTLNTGDNQGWVPSISLTALLSTLYSLFSKEMIMIDNTHQHEKSTGFFPGVYHDTFYITSKLLSDEPNQKLREIMREYVARHCAWYIRKLERLSKKHDGKPLFNYYNPIPSAKFGTFIDAFVE